MRKLILAVLLAAVCLPACSGSGGANVGMAAAQRFDPATLTVQSGDTVTFENASSETHTVTAMGDSIPDGASYFASGGSSTEAEARSDLASGLLDPGESYEVTFDVPGEYLYVCLPHEAAGMTGRIIVQDPSEG